MRNLIDLLVLAKGRVSVPELYALLVSAPGSIEQVKSDDWRRRSLLFMALIHLVVMHLINNIDVISYQFVAKRYTTPFWRTYDLVMLWLALIHGVNGARTILLDYVHGGGLRVVSLAALYVVGFIMLALGSLVILTFHPVSG